MLSNLVREVREVMMPLENLRSYTRRYSGPLAAEGTLSSASDLVVVKRQETPWQKMHTSFLKNVSLAMWERCGF